MPKLTHERRYRTVLFDFHNTLATCDPWLDLEIRTLPSLVISRLFSEGVFQKLDEDTEEQATVLFRRLRQSVRESGIELSALEGTRWVLAEMGLHPPVAYLVSAVAELENDCLKSVRMVPGADATLSELRDAGYNLGVVSSAGYPPFVERALEMLGLRTFFSEVLTSAGEGIYKSNPEIFRRAVARLGGSPEEAVHVGDHAIFDVQTAKQAGLSAIWFVANAESTARLHGTAWAEAARAGEGADAVVTRLEDVAEKIRELATA